MPMSAVGDAAAASLIALSFLCSALTASFGAGGGMLMLALMASILPSAAIIPVHALVQLGSSSARAVLARRHVARRLAAALLLGAVIGASFGSILLFRLPLASLYLTIGLFILAVVWIPLPAGGVVSLPGAGAFGSLVGFLSLFVGATGPLVSAYVQRTARDRFETVATMVACLTGLNILKLGVFTAAGFAWRDWLPLVLLMIASGLAGTWLGLRFLGTLPERLFSRLLRWLLTALAIQLCCRGAVAL